MRRRVDLAGGAHVLACVLPFCMVATLASAQDAYRYAIIAGPSQSIDGFSPSSLNEAGEVVYADNANGLIATSTDTIAQVGDTIDGESLGAIPAGSGTSINDDGLVAFRARYGSGDFDAIFTPTSVVARQWESGAISPFGFLGNPSINDAGHIVFEATVCPNMSCVSSGIFRDGVELLSTPVSDGFVELTGVSDPVSNEADLIGHYGYAYLADTSAVYHLTAGSPLARIVHTGESVGPGLILGNPRGILQGLDMNDSGDVATCWNTEAGDWVVLKNGDLVAAAGHIIDGISLTEIPNHRPAINEEGVVVFIGRTDTGFGVFTQNDVVLMEGQHVGSEIIRYCLGVAINDSGVIASHVDFESDLYGIILATPLATNRYVEMRTGSSVALRQNVDVPSDPFSMRVDHRFVTTTGQLNVRLGGVSLGSVSAPGTVSEEILRTTLPVTGALLGQNDVALELELDGPAGSTLELDNVFLPGLANGTFQTGTLAGWETVTSGAGSVEVVPEPSACVERLVCLAVLVWVKMRRLGFGTGA